jgi:cyclopropane fatty-acyl-phospholipid synthase-like methyltransferase
VLRATRRVLRRGGRTAFFTIVVPAELSAAARRRAAQVGPPSVASRSSYPSMLRSAGFVDIEERDVTAEYLDTARSWLRHVEEAADELAVHEPPERVAERITRRRTAIAAIEDGLLRRSLLTAGSRAARVRGVTGRPVGTSW